MKILLASTGSTLECFISTSIINGLIKQYPDAEIAVICQQQNFVIFQKTLAVSICVTKQQVQFFDSPLIVDLFINLNQNFNQFDKISAVKSKGINIDSKISNCINTLYGNEPSDKNIIQIYYQIAGMQWRGQGFLFRYYPRHKKKKNKSGISLSNSNLKNYILKKLKLTQSTLWTVPLKKNILKKFDQINIPSTLITDDLLSLFIGIHLRKKVIFLKMYKYNFKMIPFGTVQQFDLSSQILNIS